MNRTPGGTRIADEIDRYWFRLTLVAWAAVSIYFLIDRWPWIQALSLSDTDDNMRLMQVRALLGGQGWFDLRNYRLNPPIGFDIHWSRLVDLPIAGLILLLRPFVRYAEAERWACGIAPLLPLSIAMLGISATVRRLVDPRAWPLGLLLLLTSAVVTMQMFMPERIDHHGWQLAMLSLTVAGLADPQARRGGAIVGIASAVSLTIGLEMLPFAAMAGAIIGLRWVLDRDEADRVSLYALTLAGGSAIGFAAFASNANQVARCDALTPVWLSVMVAAGALLFLLARLNPAQRWARLVLGAIAGGAIAAGFALVFPQCLGRPEQVSPELARDWLSHIKEARPVYTFPFRQAFPIVTVPILGILGAAFATWRARRDAAKLGIWLPVLLFTIFSGLMLLWQARAGPGAQLLAIPGVTALAWLVLGWTLGHRNMLVRVLGTVIGFVAISGAFAGLAIRFLPVDQPDARTNTINHASGSCPTLHSMAPLNRYPAQTIFTFIDLGPRLVTITHHDAIAGPYHRNGDAILDVQHAFIGSPDTFRAIAKRHGATMLLVCPNMAESTIYRARAPNGFYSQLAQNKVPDWLTPLPLPKNSPLRLFKIDQ